MSVASAGSKVGAAASKPTTSSTTSAGSKVASGVSSTSKTAPSVASAPKSTSTGSVSKVGNVGAAVSGSSSTSTKNSNPAQDGGGGIASAAQNAGAGISGALSNTGTKSNNSNVDPINPDPVNWLQFADMVSSGTHNNDLGAADRARTSDPINPDSVPWQQFDDMVSSATHGDSLSAGDRAAILAALSENGSSQNYDAFRKDVNNGSMGMPGAAGYGLDANPTAPTQGFTLPDIGASIHDFLQGPYNARVAANGGQAPFEGPVDWGGIYDALQQPHKDRVTRESVLGATGIANGALPDGSALPGNTAAALNVGQPTLAQLQAIRAWNGDSGAHFDTPGVNTAAAQPPYQSSAEVQGNAYLGEGNTPALDGINAAVTGVPLPRPDPRGYGDLFSSDGQVSTPDGTVVRAGIPAADADISAPAEPNTWDKIVDNGGKILSHTGLGSIVSNLFPDLWNSGGDAMKGLGDGMTAGDPSAQTPGEQANDMAKFLAGNSRSGDNSNGGATAPTLADFIDLNHNGVDDRVEGYTPPANGTGTPGTSTSNQYDRYGDVVFPTMPPYNPGVDNEWLYFRKKMADGGVVGYADGGMVEADPRVGMIADAEDALADGGTVGHPAINKFITTFGNDKLDALRANVQGGMRMRGGRLISGPGTGKSDSIPAVITDRAGGHRPAALSDGEFVVPIEAVKGIGGGDHATGAQRLQELSDRFAKQ